MSVAALMAAMLAVTAVPAFATVHPLANSECANDAASDVATLQDPPGLTPGSQAQSEQLATPVFAVRDAQGADSPAFKTEPVPGPLESCPANK